MSKYTNLSAFLSEMPDYVFEYIQMYYTGDSINTQLGYSMDIRVFLKFLIQHKFRTLSSPEDVTCEMLDEVTVRDFVEFKAYLREYTADITGADGRIIHAVRRNSPYGINRKLSAVSGLFKYLYKTDRLKQNITEKVDFSKLHHKIKKPLTTQETVSLLDVIYNGEKYYEGRYLAEYERVKKRDSAIFTAYLGTGVRVSELAALNIRDIYFEDSTFIVTRKGGDQQEIIMPVQVENELFAYMKERLKVKGAQDPEAVFLSRRGTRLTTSAIEKQLKKYCLTAGITDPDKTRPHALRRTFACRLLEDGVDIKMVAELMGHKNIEVTHRYYAQYSQHAKREVMRGVRLPENTGE